MLWLWQQELVDDMLTQLILNYQHTVWWLRQHLVLDNPHY